MTHENTYRDDICITVMCIRVTTVKFGLPDNSDVFLRLLSIMHTATVFYIATVHYMKDKV